jgi:3-hydroxyisobutyrate dehydrogenase-like beta-hydroxyacid dehydrogenase
MCQFTCNYLNYATVHASAAQAAGAAEVVVSMLENGAVVEDVLFAQGAARAMKPGTLVIDMASIKPREARDHAARLADIGVAHLDAPVSGGTVGAELARWSSWPAAVLRTSSARNRCVPGVRARHACGSARHGPAGQAGQPDDRGHHHRCRGRGLAVCRQGRRRHGQGASEAIQGGFADSRILQLHGQRMVERDFTPHGRLSVQLKDMRNALATAQEIGFDAPITQLFEALYAAGDEHGLGGLDHSGLFVELASRNAMQ